jgi:hypothetical protein
VGNMVKLLLGTILTLLTYDISNGSGGLIGIIPHFLGFFLILLAVNGLEKESTYFERVQIPTYIMIVYSLAYYLLKAFGFITKIEGWNRFMLYFIDFVEAAGTLFVCYLVLMAVSNVEHKRKKDFKCKRTQNVWKFMTLTYIFYYISYMTNLVMQNYITTVISLIFKGVMSLGIVIYLLVFYQSWGRYMQAKI